MATPVAIPEAALVWVKRMIKSMPVDDPQVKVLLLNQACSLVWMAAPWRWTLKSGPSIPLVASTENYTITSITDLLYIYDAYATTGADVPRELAIEPTLATPGLVTGNVSAISLETNGSVIRVAPIPGSTVPSGLTVVSRYKRIAPVITGQTCTTPGFLEMPDEWFFVYVSAVLYFAYLYADDQRAGGASATEDGRVQFTGQRGILEANLLFMKQREKLPLQTRKDNEPKEGRK
jgi:hypothetical protein